ncbi:sulfurtransferase TusA family protein [Vibrio astriarenae]|jgi:TusA-related sulfurtransferase|uniref:Sulfurtransferase TusA family protein n=1 Tax=Vibrio agarivorans TaxID=153622 RepID=A0ABT7XXU9_9VIBR|nr:sulfurtransferase TusA family protein [Vibrio agarivorans]MDN2480585.1 sulfurtransferase TusA family protein [Vibrio agarivorans]
MSDTVLDLRQQRCPLALLLAKRFVAQAPAKVSLRIEVQDRSSCQDIERYLVKHNFCYSIEHNDSESVISLNKDN